jgi:hypothetical protein
LAAALVAAAAVLAFLAACQLLLPGIAAGRLRSMLSRSGSVKSVSVSAWPAVELLWHHADSVTVSMRSWSSSPVRLNGQLGQLHDVGALHASIGVVHVGALTAHQVAVSSTGGQIIGRGTVREADLRGAVPFLRSVVPVTNSDGTLVLRGTASVLGLIGGSLDATVQVRRGALIVSPDVPLGGLATVTVFSARGVRVTGVSAASVRGGFIARVTARLR